MFIAELVFLLQKVFDCIFDGSSAEIDYTLSGII